MLVFIVPFYNVEKYIEECLLSLVLQKEKQWRAILIDDCSTDNSVSKIPADSRFTIIRNERRLTALSNIHCAITDGGLHDDDVICILDGDDKLTSSTVCWMINEIYSRFNPLITYGQYVTSTGYLGHCQPYTPSTFQNLRNMAFIASHLRTFRYKLYKQISLQDPELSCFKNKNGEMYNMAYDVAIMTPMLEIAGFNRILFNPYPVYYYRIHEQNDHIIDFPLQTAIANEIYKKNRFNQVF